METAFPLVFLRITFSRALKKAGIEDFTFHDLRDTFASQQVMRGVPLRTVQEIIGYTSFTTTLRYAHLAPSHTRKVMEVSDFQMETIWTPQGGTRKSKQPVISRTLTASDFEKMEPLAQSVEHRPFKPRVAGSIPARLTRPHRLVVRTPLFQGGNGGSIPPEGTRHDIPADSE